MVQNATTSDLQKLSKEELIKLLETANAKATHFEKEAKHAMDDKSKLAASYEKKIASLKAKPTNSQLEKKLAKAESKNAELKEKLATTEQKAKELEDRLKNISIFNQQRMEMMKELVLRIQKEYVVFDKASLLTVEEQLEKVYEEFGQWIIYASVYKGLAFGSGSDLNDSKVNVESDDVENDAHDSNDKADGTDANAKQNAENTENAAASVASIVTEASLQYMKAMEAAGRHFDKVIAELEPKDIGACGEAVSDIGNTAIPESDQKAPKPKKGRQKKNWTPSRNEHPHPKGKAKQEDVECPYCHKPYTLTEYDLKHRFLNIKQGLQNRFEFIETAHDFMFCPECGHVHVRLNDNEDVPIQPDFEIGLKTAILACESIFRGNPLTRMARDIQFEYGIGHTTCQRELKVFIRAYLGPFADEILRRLKEQLYVIMDGTPYHSLENQGRGNCMNKNKDRKLNHNEPVPDEVVPGKSNYILSACTVAMSKKQYVYYDFLPTRSYKSIEKVFTSDFKAKYIICDAFNGYDTLAKERDIKVQDCLIHFRRYIIRALEPKKMADELLAMPDDKRLEYIKSLHHKGKDCMLLYWAFNAISKIYSLEASVDCDSPNALKQIQKVRLRERKLMQNIDAIMLEMVHRHMVLNKKGNYQEKRGDVYSKVATYWYRNHEKFGTYLDDPMIPPDSNRVEQAIRRITILRKNSYHSTSQQGIKDLCTIFTVFGTLQKIGVQYPAEFLAHYSRALYQHCIDRKFTEKAYNEGIEGLKKQVTSWDLVALSDDFDFAGFFAEHLKEYSKF